MGTLFVVDALTPHRVTVSVRTVVPEAPAVTVTDGAVVEESVPLVTAHEYVAPLPALAADAVNCAPLQTPVSALPDGGVNSEMAAVGGTFSGTARVSERVVLQEESVTVSSVSPGAEPDVYVMRFVSAPSVIVPFVIDHE